MATMNFSGILSRKAGMKASSNRVSNPVFTTKDGDIAGRNPDGSVTIIATQRVIDADEAETLSRAARASAASRKSHAEADAMRAAAQEAEVLNTEATAKKEAAPAPKKATATKKAATKKEAAPTPAPAAPEQAAPTPKEAAPVAQAPTTPKKSATKKDAATPKKSATPKKAEESTNMALRLSLVEYTDKSLALFGDCWAISKELTRIGGAYNRFLRPFGSAKPVPGWIFSKKKKDDLMKLINKY